jgi:hypothetical protein
MVQELFRKQTYMLSGRANKMDGSGRVLVAHACNPSYSGAEIRRIVVRSQPR